jgi:peptidoglycan/LPS O-acetylase OafA/YrhL
VSKNFLDRGLSLPPAFRFFKLLFQNGNLGVNFFFVLSGFLITFLLVKEKEITGRIQVNKFYIRRILRIWPLFYLCVFLGFVIFPSLTHFTGGETRDNGNPILYIFFLNNFDVLDKGIPASLILGILWSIAVEEQFYLTWPLLLSILPLRYFKYACLTIIAGSLLFRFIHCHEPRVLYFHTFAVIGDMATGGLLAYFTSYPSKFLNWIIKLNKQQIIAVYIIAAVIFLVKQILFTSPLLSVFERLSISVLFAFVIAEQNFSDNSFYKFTQFKVVSSLGVYTYGLYCLQFVGIYTAIALLSGLNTGKHMTMLNAGMGLLALAVTLLLSFFSYHIFEKRFLAFKDRFAIIVK